MTVKLADMFGTDDPARQGQLVAEYHDAMTKSLAATDAGEVRWDSINRRPVTMDPAVRTAREAIEHLDRIEKAYGAGADAAMAQDLATLRESLGTINKDWTPTSPVAAGLVPYDLEAPAKVLVPKHTPLRNSLPRVKGQGNARQFRRILSFTNAGIAGGAASTLPFFSSLTQTATFGGPGNLTLNRPGKISYTGDSKSIGYVELGFSDQVDWLTQFQGLGFDDVRGISHTALLWAHLMGEERAILYGRGATGLGYAGTVAAPGSVTTGTATTGGSIAAATYSVYVVALTGTGQSAPSTVATQVTTGSTSTITVTVGSEPTGAIYYGLYVGTTAGITNATLQTTFVGNTYTLTAYTTSGVAGVAADSSFTALAYDGFLTVQSDPAQTGYLKRVNAAWSTANPGDEINTALAVMYAANGATPDQAWMTAALRKSFTDLLRIGNGTGAANGYRTEVRPGDNGVTVGNVVTGIVNPNTGDMLDINTHRFMLPGAVLLRSTSIGDVARSVPNPVQMVNVQDYMAVDWPQIQMSYDASTYQIGTMEHIAPGWSGLLLGVWSTSTAGV